VELADSPIRSVGDFVAECMPSLREAPDNGRALLA
jgi:hypothetical protein